MKNSHAALAVFFSFLMLSPVAYGYDITIDATEVDTSINIGFGYIPEHGTETYDLSTGITYSVFSYPGGYDICRFHVDANGHVVYDESVYGGRVQGNGTSTLKIPGHDITLDGTGVDTDLRVYNLHHIGTTNFGGSFTYRLPANDPNTPFHGYSIFSYPGGYDLCTFWVNEDGTVGFDGTEYDGRFEGNATPTLRAIGYEVTIDGTSVDTNLQIYAIPQTTNYGGILSLRLPANQELTPFHQYRIKSSPGGFVLDRFTVNPGGAVTYDPSLDGVTVTGLDTNSLQIIGHPILLDATEVSANVAMYGLSYTYASETGLYFLPSNHFSSPYLLYSNPGGWVTGGEFNINNDGTCALKEISYEYGIIRLSCGFAIDSDSDGLTDNEEETIGTDPNDPDTDDDGLNDGTEVELAQGTGCPSPLNPDSDGDTLLDGAEVDAGTNPCDPDTDGDDIPDNIDPYPLDPEGTVGFIEDGLLDLAAFIRSVDLSRFDAPNNNANKGRRTALANRANAAAKETAKEDHQAAIDVLTSLLNRVDGQEIPKDWMIDSDEKAEIVERASLLIALLGFVL